MDLHSLLIGLLVWIIYPLWLVAGFFDYICHRRTAIESTSGVHESWLHVAQFFSLGIGLLIATFLAITPLALILLLVLIATHTVLSFVDVAYTDKRRYISPLEQKIHGFMDVLPIVAVALIAVLNWDTLQNAAWTLYGTLTPHAWLLPTSYLVLSGVPIFEELIRASSHGIHHRSL